MKKRSEPFAAAEFREICDSKKEIWEWNDFEKVFSQSFEPIILNLCPDEEKTMRASSLWDMVNICILKFYRLFIQ
jgi:hypothetical protein